MTTVAKINPATEAQSSISAETVERRTREIGRDLFKRIGSGPAFWRRAWWETHFMNWMLADPSVRVQLFRFIDALPALTTSNSIRRHLAEYLDEGGGRVPWPLAMAVRLAPEGTRRAEWLAWSAREAASLMSRKFIAGSTPAESLKTVRALRRRHLAFTADLLGEAVISEAEADQYQRTCLEMIRGLAGPLANEPEIPLIDRDDHGPIPRVNLSIKLSSLTPHFDPIHREATIERVGTRLRPILRDARELGAYIHVDMEQYAYRDLTIDLFREVLTEPEFRDWPDVGIVIQAYQPDAPRLLTELRDWSARRGTPVTIRLVKGAYWDYEVLTARRLGWPLPVFLEKWESDASYERCGEFLIDNHELLRPAFGSHNVRSLSHAIAVAESRGLPKSAYELQVLHGMGDAIADALVERGHRVRVYTPYGAMLPGMAYLVRRLLENTSNDSFIKASFTDHAQVEDLLRDPEEVGSMFTRTRRPGAKTTSVGSADGLPPFRNEPTTDFALAENRDAMRRAIDLVRRELGRRDESGVLVGAPPVVEPIVGGSRIEIDDSKRLDLTSPNDTRLIVARIGQGDASLADRAVESARGAASTWAETPARERAAVLIRAASIMRERRFELAAREIFECAKPWREADGDICEAIDFCEFYAREMIRLAEPRHRDVPGETNYSEHLPRGIAVVIPPWNFPLAIPCGMTVAALVAGNPVVFKPAEQSPAIAWQFARILFEAGLPTDVLQFVPGTGEEVGAALVNHPDVNLISFTGSRDVGLLINRQAAEVRPGQDHVKRVIAEMGGKNAAIIDDDADLDEAVVGVIGSAFGYSGQKCSACSRAVVLEGIYDAFVSRIAEAARSIKVGSADDPETLVGPVIDSEARARIEGYQKLAESEGRIVFRGDLGDLGTHGHFVPPLIVADVASTSKLAQEEIFGPVLSIIKAKDLDDALRIANGTQYALTGSIYSRSPDHIEQARRAFRVGNLYINRGTTGAMVDRQPFGGFKLSGIGTKTGGPDYLLEFLLTRSVSENTMRRGFAPE
jgi:RHH-type proline utilization regulon transcriptional repressor/proline dehydrogenase/delta 1-pyrroline-5-carboxylate dehydrogenase